MQKSAKPIYISASQLGTHKEKGDMSFRTVILADRFTFII